MVKRNFAKLAKDVSESAPRFREWFDAAAPELEKLPLDWRELDKRPFLKLLVVRCFRPDRMTQVSKIVSRSLLFFLLLLLAVVIGIYDVVVGGGGVVFCRLCCCLCCC